MQRKKTFYGVTIGILMVKSSFRRYLGDVGNALTFPFPVQYRIVEEALPARMTTLHRWCVLEPCKRAADELIEAGVDGITTTCGFLSLYQEELAAHCRVPVATSSLLQVPLVARLLPAGKRVGILTFDGEALKGPYLDAVGVPQDTPLYGMPRTSSFRRWIGEADNSITFPTLREEAVAATRVLLARVPGVGATVSECTKLAPFSHVVHQPRGVPVFGIVSTLSRFLAGLSPPRYESP